MFMVSCTAGAATGRRALPGPPGRQEPPETPAPRGRPGPRGPPGRPETPAPRASAALRAPSPETPLRPDRVDLPGAAAKNQANRRVSRRRRKIARRLDLRAPYAKRCPPSGAADIFVPLVPREKIDDVRDRTNIVDVVKRHVELKRAGTGSWKGLCPFHSEKTPSFTSTSLGSSSTASAVAKKVMS